MRILYGVAGEGMGHATRSHAFLADLVGDHDVLVVASGRAHDYLAQHFPQVREILGFSLAYEDNAIRRWETVVQNLRGAVSGWPAQVRSFYEVARDFEPDVVVSDFESFVLTVARRERVPAISVDNIMMLDRCRHDEGIVGDDTLDFELARQIARTKARRSALGDRADVLPPAAAAHGDDAGRAGAAGGGARRRGGAGRAPPRLPDGRRQRDPGRGRCTRPGCPAGSTACAATSPRTSSDGELVYRPFSETVFLDDLRTARGVIAGGGFSLLSECVYLHKPALSIPVAGQFEQTLNARYLERLGYGEYAEAPSPEAIRAFLERLPEHERALAGYAQDGNHEALAALREQLALVALERAGKRARRTRPVADGRPSESGDASGAPA